MLSTHGSYQLNFQGWESYFQLYWSKYKFRPQDEFHDYLIVSNDEHKTIHTESIFTIPKINIKHIRLCYLWRYFDSNTAFWQAKKRTQNDYFKIET